MSEYRDWLDFTRAKRAGLINDDENRDVASLAFFHVPALLDMVDSLVKSLREAREIADSLSDIKRRQLWAVQDEELNKIARDA